MHLKPKHVLLGSALWRISTASFECLNQTFTPYHKIHVDYKEYPSFTRCLTSEYRLPKRHHLVKEILASNEYHILVLGGSVTAGVDCNDGISTFKTCAWPARLEHWLSHRFPKTKFNLENQGAGGTPMSAAIASLSFYLTKKPRLIIIDYTGTQNPFLTLRYAT